MNFNYGKLRGRIIEKFGTLQRFAKVINYSARTVSLKLNGKISFNQKDMAVFCEALCINMSDIPSYFFVPNVQDAEQI